MLSRCEIVEASTGVRLGQNAHRVWITDNHIRARDAGIEITEGADYFIIRDNMIGAKKAIDDRSEPTAAKKVEGNISFLVNGSYFVGSVNRLLERVERGMVVDVHASLGAG